MSSSAQWPRELLLIRHAESAGNVARDAAEAAGAPWIEIAERDMDVALSPAGMEQARALGHWIGTRDDPPAVIVASPYRRAAQTAETALATAQLTVPVVLDERLREREFGVLDRLTRRGITERYPDEAAARAQIGKFYYRPPSGESWCDVALRVRSCLDTIGREHPDERVMVVAHQVVILMFRYVLERLTEAEVLAIGTEAELLNCSLTSYRRDHEPPFGLRLDAYNTAVALQQDDAPITREPDVSVTPG
jgi:probable phosphoglycerate mutase